MRLPSLHDLGSSRERALWQWDAREYFSTDLKDYWTIHYMNRLKTILDAVSEIVPTGGRILDVGCAQGTAAILLAERGYDVTAVDADPGCLAYARRRYEFGKCQFACLDASRNGGLKALSGSFHAVVLGEVLEHVPRPGHLVARCGEKIQRGGGLVITTPNGESPHNWRFQRYDPMVMELSEREEIPSGLGGRESHLFNFGIYSLLDLVEKASLRVQRWEYLNSYVINPIGLHRLFSITKAAALNRFCARLPVLARYSTMTLFVVARKA